LSLHCALPISRIVCAYIENGVSRLALIDTRTKEFEPIDCPYTDIRFVRAAPGMAVMRAGSPAEAPGIVSFDSAKRTFEVLRRSSSLEIDAAYISTPRAVGFPTEDGLTAYGFYYAPKNPEYRAPEGERPPLLVESHGGPTSSAVSEMTLGIQYWTSRGIAVLDVYYGGSTGFGRAYRERLKGK